MDIELSAPLRRAKWTSPEYAEVVKGKTVEINHWGTRSRYYRLKKKMDV